MKESAMDESNKPIVQVAAKAVLVNAEGKILILREASTYKDGIHLGVYHQPGGRIDPGEGYEQSLRREIEEESGITDVELTFPVYVGEWRPVIKGVPHHILGIYTICKTKTSSVRVSSEHDSYLWITPDEVGGYELLPHDRAALEAYKRLMQTKFA